MPFSCPIAEDGLYEGGGPEPSQGIACPDWVGWESMLSSGDVGSEGCKVFISSGRPFKWETRIPARRT